LNSPKPHRNGRATASIQDPEKHLKKYLGEKLFSIFPITSNITITPIAKILFPIPATRYSQIADLPTRFSTGPAIP
jgi:hypothetical protein